MTAFTRRDGVLYVEGVRAAALAEAAGTPLYVYGAGTLRDRYQRLDAALGGVPHRIHYSLKANASRGILDQLRAVGSGVDVVSGGELFKALRAGFPASDILFGGVGKSDAELRDAIVAGVKMINVESVAEIERIAAIAASLGATPAVGLRVNPEVAVSNAHHYIATGEKGHKFGIPYDEAFAAGESVLAHPALRLVGLDMHVGSQLHAFDAYADGARRLGELAERLRAAGAPLRYLDVGGGLPVPYEREAEPDLAAFAALVVPVAQRLRLELLVEPGRFFAAATGGLLTRVLYVKQSGGTTFVICDAGMTELLRPSHYDAYHKIEAVAPRGARTTADVVGPVCETGDFLALGREMDAVEPGDLLAVHTTGAYGYVMASNYNARPRAAEVMVDGSRWATVTARESYAELVHLDVENPQWRDA
ncbi:MAG: diaminopimelate decarboxylase [Gemmatimonadaceae bacterium]|nr:diaminopimelate decarboxylase [Gemmatimonadaceae bacterium]